MYDRLPQLFPTPVQMYLLTVLPSTFDDQSDGNNQFCMYRLPTEPQLIVEVNITTTVTVHQIPDEKMPVLIYHLVT